jgi:hypothetical protein
VTQVPAVPFVLKDCLVTIGTDSYEKAVTKVQLTPSASVQVAKAVSPGAVYTDTDEASWTLDLEWLQDWATPANLGAMLHAAEGDTVPFVFEPITGGATITVEVVVTPGPIGGGVGVYAPASCSMGCVGKPVIAA